ncbi:MAG TPA: IS110 family transposase [Planctomycetaceae bacterium]
MTPAIFRPPVRLECSRAAEIEALFRGFGEFRAVVEASGTDRRFHRLVSPLGSVVLAHPFLLRAIVQRRSKTDRLDAQLLANLLRIDRIPLSYVPSDEYRLPRDVTRHRARLGRGLAAVKTSLRALLARHDREPLDRYPFGPRGLYRFSKRSFGPADDMARDELLGRFPHDAREIAAADRRPEELRPRYPQVEAPAELYGIGLSSAMPLVGELGDVTRFRRAKQVAAYAGLTARVHQSGEHCDRGHVSKQGSPWRRRLPVEAATKLVRRDVALANFYARIRRRSGAKIARVAAARKLSEICWKRLVRWHREHVPAAA